MQKSPKILVISGDNEALQSLVKRLEDEGFKPQLALNRTQASALLRNLRFDLVLCEAQLPDGSGEQCILDALPYLGSTPVVFITAAGEVAQAVRLLKAGAADCIEKPYDPSDLLTRLRTALNRSELPERSWPDPILISPPMRELGLRLERLAGTRINLLITGESGTGKEIVARYLHRHATRSSEPFVEVACASLSGADGERILFGELIRHADEQNCNPGAFEEVGRGTLFLDGIDEMPLGLQGRLAQLMDEGRFHRVGDVSPIPFEGRIVAASELSGAALREKLRSNLFHRFAILDIEVPPLRERQADLAPLAESLMNEIALELNISVMAIEAEALSALAAHDWPGNVRELRNRLLRAMSLAKGDRIGVEDLFPDMQFDEALAPQVPTLEQVRSDAERQRIMDALAAHHWRIAATARSLGISRVTLWGKMKRLGISTGAGGLFLVRKKSEDAK